MSRDRHSQWYETNVMRKPTLLAPRAVGMCRQVTRHGTDDTPMARTPRILVVEDQALVAGLISDALSGKYEVICAQTVPDAVEHLLGAISTWSCSTACCRVVPCGRWCWNPIVSASLLC